MECTIDVGFEAITGTDLLRAVPGGVLALEPGQVYVLAIVVPDSMDDPIWSTANVISGHLEGLDTPQEKLAEALQFMGERSGDLVSNVKK